MSEEEIMKMGTFKLDHASKLKYCMFCSLEELVNENMKNKGSDSSTLEILTEVFGNLKYCLLSIVILWGAHKALTHLVMEDKIEVSRGIKWFFHKHTQRFVTAALGVSIISSVYMGYQKAT